jgi:hypothetical protein
MKILPTNVILIGAIITGIGALIVAFGNYKQQLKSSEKTKDIQDKLISVHEKLNSANEQSAKHANDLIEAQKEIHRLQNEVIKEVVGDGFPVVEFQNSSNSMVRAYISNKSKYSFRPKEYVFGDGTELIKHGSKVVGESIFTIPNLKLIKVYTAENILPNVTIPTQYLFEKSEDVRYVLTIIPAANIRTVQYSVIKFEGDKILHEYQIFRIEKNNSFTLLEEKGDSMSERLWNEKFPYMLKIEVPGF